MNKIMLYFLALLLFSQSTYATSNSQKVSLGNDVNSLKSLKSSVHESFIKSNGRITVAMVYQPDCSWCKK